MAKVLRDRLRKDILVYMQSTGHMELILFQDRQPSTRTDKSLVYGDVIISHQRLLHSKIQCSLLCLLFSFSSLFFADEDIKIIQFSGT